MELSKWQIKTKLYELWLHNPRCAICGKVTVKNDQGGYQPPETLTAGHLYAKTDIRRFICGDIQVECFQCNNTKAKAENVGGIPKIRHNLLVDLLTGDVEPRGIHLYGILT